MAFPDFPEGGNPNDEEQVVRFIASKFLQCFDAENIKLATPLHIHRTVALYTNRIPEQEVFRDIILDLIKLELRELGMI